MLYKCQATMVRVRHDEQRCCQEMPIWHGEEFSVAAFLQPISKKVSKVCTPRVCNSFDNPLFNIGTPKIPNWIRIEDGEIKKSEANSYSRKLHHHHKVQEVAKRHQDYRNH